MTERPIVLEQHEVLAILSGQMSQISIPVKPQPNGCVNDWSWHAEPGPVIYRGWPHMLKESRGRQKRSAGELCPSKIKCPIGDVSDCLWVQEHHYIDARESEDSHNPAIIYAATPELAKEKLPDKITACRFIDGGMPTRIECQKNLDNHKFQRLQPPGRMPRWASRITLEITVIEVEKVDGEWTWRISFKRIEIPETR